MVTDNHTILKFRIFGTNMKNEQKYEMLHFREEVNRNLKVDRFHDCVTTEKPPSMI